MERTFTYLLFYNSKSISSLSFFQFFSKTINGYQAIFQCFVNFISEEIVVFSLVFSSF